MRFIFSGVWSGPVTPTPWATEPLIRGVPGINRKPFMERVIGNCAEKLLGDYQKLKAGSEQLDLYGWKVNVLTLDGLIQAKKASNRPKDQLVLKELQALQKIKQK